MPKGTSDSCPTWSSTPFSITNNLSCLLYFLSPIFSIIIFPDTWDRKVTVSLNVSFYFISHINNSWILAYFNLKNISNPLCWLHPCSCCCNAILMRFCLDHCHNLLRGFRICSLPHSILYFLPENYMLFLRKWPFSGLTNISIKMKSQIFSREGKSFSELNFAYFSFIFIIYLLFFRERECMCTHTSEWGRGRGRGGERERERERERNRLLSRLHVSAWILMWGSIPWPWNHDLSQNQESDV